MMELESLTCPVCLEVMCDPVMLPLCGHSLCRVCLASIAPQPRCCPICRTEHHGPSPQKLPTNFCVASLTSSHLKVEDKMHIRKRSFTQLEFPSAPPFSPAIENDQEITMNIGTSMNIDQSFPEESSHISTLYPTLQNTKLSEMSNEEEESHICTLHPTLQNTKLSDMSNEKIVDTNVFTFIHALQLVMITVIILALKLNYGWMILDWLFNITQKNYNSFEKLYLLIFGCFGLPKFLHLVYRFFKGNPSNFEISLFVHYFIFDIIWILVGLVFEVILEVFLRVIIPSTILMGFGISVSALSVTTLPITPDMRASSGCARFIGYIFLGLSIVGFVSSFISMIILGIINFTGYEQLYLIVVGVCGLQTSIHGIYRLIKGKSFQYENYMFILYLIIQCIWFLVGLSGGIPLSSLIFWLSNAPSLSIIVISILISSHSLTPALLYCCANTYNALI